MLKDLTGCSVTVEEGAKALQWPIINIDRIVQEFDFQSISLLDKLEDLIDGYKSILLKGGGLPPKT